MNAFMEKNEVRIYEKVGNNLGQLSSTLPNTPIWSQTVRGEAHGLV